MKIGIIGSGPAGLPFACLMAKRDPELARAYEALRPQGVAL